MLNNMGKKDYEIIVEDNKNQNIWIRGLYIILFLVIGYFLYFIILGVTIFQYVYTVLCKQPNQYILSFTQSLSTYAYEIIRFITYNSDKKPFPFDSWPKDH